LPTNSIETLAWNKPEVEQDKPKWNIQTAVAFAYDAGGAVIDVYGENKIYFSEIDKIVKQSTVANVFSFPHGNGMFKGNG